MNANKKVNVGLFLYSLFSMFPTMLCGLAGIKITGALKTAIWGFDIASIVAFFIICLVVLRGLPKRVMMFVAYFVAIIVFQLIMLNGSLKEGFVEPYYFVLPFAFFLHFLYSFCMLGQIKLKKYDSTLFFKLLLCFVIFACIFNIIKNISVITSISSITNRYVHISSFFDHRNSFGQLLLIGIASNSYLISKTGSRKYRYLMLFLFLNLVLSFSRTAIFSTVVFMFVYNFRIIRRTIKKKRIIHILLLILGVLTVVLIVKNEKTTEFINYYILRKEDGLTGRDSLWMVGLSMLTGIHVLFGYGFGAAHRIIQILSSFTNSHNTIIEILLNGGIVLLLFYVMVYLKIIISVVRLKDAVFRRYYLSFFLVYLIYSFFEKVLIFGTGYASALFTTIVVVLPLLHANSEAQNNNDHEVRYSRA